MDNYILIMGNKLNQLIWKIIWNYPVKLKMQILNYSAYITYRKINCTCVHKKVLMKHETEGCIKSLYFFLKTQVITSSCFCQNTSRSPEMFAVYSHQGAISLASWPRFLSYSCVTQPNLQLYQWDFIVFVFVFLWRYCFLAFY